MTLNDAIIEAPRTGNCKIDLEKAVMAFDEKCFILKWHNEYRLIRRIYKKATALKVTIRETDARQLIKKLNLIEIHSLVFNNASTFKLRDSRVQGLRSGWLQK